MEREKEKLFTETGVSLGYFSAEDVRKAEDAQKVDQAIGQQKPIANYLFEQGKVNKEQIAQILVKLDGNVAEINNHKLIAAIPVRMYWRLYSVLCTKNRMIIKEVWAPGLFSKLFYISTILSLLLTAGLAVIFIIAPFLYYIKYLKDICRAKTSEFRQAGVFRDEVKPVIDFECQVGDIQSFTIASGSVVKMKVKSEEKVLSFFDSDAVTELCKVYPQIVVNK